MVFNLVWCCLLPWSSVESRRRRGTTHTSFITVMHSSRSRLVASELDQTYPSRIQQLGKVGLVGPWHRPKIKNHRFVNQNLAIIKCTWSEPIPIVQKWSQKYQFGFSRFSRCVHVKMWCVHVKITVFHGHLFVNPLQTWSQRYQFWFSRFSRWVHVKMWCVHNKNHGFPRSLFFGPTYPNLDFPSVLVHDGSNYVK
jgi:phosphatidylserine/phosphatidylglycerophosphate/cardiolipin synthase-like enzyme